MKFSKKIHLKYLISGVVLLATVGVATSTMSSCANVDTNIMKMIDAQSISAKTEFSKLNTINDANVKNLIYGTKSFNNGNYVLAIGTYSDLSQWQFFNGAASQGPADPKRWEGEFGTTIQYLSGNSSPIKDFYPSGIKFGLFIDEATNIANSQDNTNNKNNPFAKYPTITSENEKHAPQEAKDRAGKYRREDESAVRYRDIVNLIYNTYSSNSTVAAWYSASAELPTSSNTNTYDPSQDSYSQITKYMLIAYKQNKDGVIVRDFYSAGSSSSGGGDSTTPDTENPDSGDDTGNNDNNTNDGGSSDSNGETTTPETKTKNISISPRVSVVASPLISFLESFYKS